MQNQELIKCCPVTWTPSPLLQPVKYKKITVDMLYRPGPDLANALDAAADALEREARRLRRRADAARQADAAARDLTRRLNSARDIARRALISGAPLHAASHAVMHAQTGLPIDTAIWLAAQEARALDRTQRQRRNEAIIRMKSRGLSNAQIGQRLNLHAKSVARIVSQMRRR